MAAKELTRDEVVAVRLDGFRYRALNRLSKKCGGNCTASYLANLFIPPPKVLRVLYPYSLSLKKGFTFYFSLPFLSAA